MSEGFRKILLYLRIAMPILFILIGIYCLVFPERVELDPTMSRLLGVMIVAYGIFRGYRAYIDIQRDSKR